MNKLKILTPVDPPRLAVNIRRWLLWTLRKHRSWRVGAPKSRDVERPVRPLCLALPSLASPWLPLPPFGPPLAFLWLTLVVPLAPLGTSFASLWSPIRRTRPPLPSLGSLGLSWIPLGLHFRSSGGRLGTMLGSLGHSWDQFGSGGTQPVHGLDGFPNAG